METELRILPHQLEVLKSQKREIFLGGGVGAGKTMIGSLWTLRKAQTAPKEVYGLIVSNTYSQLYDTTVRAFYKTAEMAGCRLHPSSIPRSKGPNDILLQGRNGVVRILLRSLEHYERLSGLEIGFAWVDECWQTVPEAIDLLNARLRDKRMDPNQLLFTTTLDDPSTWMHKRFVEDYAPEFQDVIYARTGDNPNLPETYLDTLKRTYSDSVFRRMVLSEWVALDESRIYSSFSRAVNVSDNVELQPGIPVIWTHDFNVALNKPMSSAVMQYHQRTDTFCILDEIIVDGADTHDAIAEFQARYSRIDNPIIVCGDAAGWSKDTRSRMNDYEIIRRSGFPTIRAPRSNPGVRDRHNLVNAYCKNARDEVRLLVHPKCKTIIKGMETVHLKKGSSYVEDDSQREQHVTSALGYAIWEFTQHKGQVHQIRIGGI